jgi:hypothetical protein
MTIGFTQAYPVEATNAAWQKKKSFMDKAKKATKTGLGAELLKAEGAYKKINFEALDIRSAAGQLGNPAKFTSPQDFDDAKQKAAQHMTTVVKPASAALLTAARSAAKTKSNAALSATAKAAAAAIEKKLLTQSGYLRDIKLDDFDQRKAVVVQHVQNLIRDFDTNMRSAIGKGDIYINKVKQTPTPKTFNDGIKNACRDLTQNLANVKKIKSMGGTFAKETPTNLIAPILAWAQDKNKLPVTATREQVLQTLDTYEKSLGAIKRWAA